jgi:UMF1 family MFS transporter
MAIASSKAMFYFIAVLAGLVMGSSQSIARSWLAHMVPEKKRFEFFGFNGFASKASAVTGPLIFGIISSLAGQRIAMISLLPFFAIAFAIFYKIKE